MPPRRKTWNEKLDIAREAEVQRIDKKFADIPAGATMLVATPRIVEAYVRQIPKGYSTSIKKMRADLAAEYQAEYTCPVTSGIFLRIVSEAGWEQLQNGVPVEEVIPFWRAIEPKAPLRKKLSFPVEEVDRLRGAEGLPIDSPASLRQ